MNKNIEDCENTPIYRVCVKKTGYWPARIASDS